MARQDLAQRRPLVVAAGLLPERAAGVEPATGGRVRRATAGRRSAGSARGCPRPPGPASAPPTSATSCTGAAARAYSSSDGASSTSAPRYMTPTTSAMCRTTARSWAITRYVSPSSVLQLLQQVEHLGLDRDVQRRHRLVGDRSARGSSASARAMPMRWRWPPENSCG